MTLTIDLAPDEEALFRQRAAEVGKDIGTFVHDVAVEAIRRPTLAQVLAPIHAANAKAGLSVEEIESMADRAVEEVRSERLLARSRKIP